MHILRTLIRAIGLIDLRDVLCFGGLLLAGAGVWQIYPPAAYIVIGAALFWLSVR